jgi:hypothetical protein
MPDYSRLIKMRITNFGCIGPEGLDIELDKIIALVGPNNTGKTTVLRAYEAAVGNQVLSQNEICLNSKGESTTVEIYVHIPTGTKNIDEDWIFTEDNLRLVRSKWEWHQANVKPIRKTWNPKINEYAVDAKASGLDTVFSSRLPQPLRIEALAGPFAYTSLNINNREEAERMLCNASLMPPLPVSRFLKSLYDYFI